MVSDGEWSMVSATSYGTAGTGAGMAECGLDNRDIVDDGSAQALKESDILRLRAQTRGQVLSLFSVVFLWYIRMHTLGCSWDCGRT